MKIFWYIISLLTILLILLNTPKSSTLGGFGNTQVMFNLTRGSQQKLQVLTSLSVFMFFLLTIFFALYSYE